MAVGYLKFRWWRDVAVGQPCVWDQGAPPSQGPPPPRSKQEPDQRVSPTMRIRFRSDREGSGRPDRQFGPAGSTARSRRRQCSFSPARVARTPGTGGI